MLRIDGAQGEGGGQVLRTSLTCALLTNQSFTIERIRANRRKPGLMRQHLTCVQAAAAIGGATVTGDALHSDRVTFAPGTVTPGDYAFAVGTAGSLHLVLQTILLPLALADAPSTVVLEGGTHNPKAPPFEFLERSWLPQVRAMGLNVDLIRERSGFYPAGGGRVRVEITPGTLAPLTLVDIGEVTQIRATAIVSNLPRKIATRELQVLRERLSLSKSRIRERFDPSPGPGNAVFVEVRTTTVNAVFFAFGEKGRRAEDVAEDVAGQVNAFLEGGVPVEEYLQDQLLLPMCFGGGGVLHTVTPSSHTRTNLDVLAQFTGVKHVCTHTSKGRTEIRLSRD